MMLQEYIPTPTVSNTIFSISNVFLKIISMKKNASIMLVFMFWVNYYSTFAQSSNNKTDSLSIGLKQIANIGSTPTWIKFNNSAKINQETLFEDYQTAFGLSDADKMIVNKLFSDDAGFTHRNYQQYYKSVPIDGESVNVHTNKNGETYAASGRILKGINIEISPNLTAQEVIDSALKFVNAKKYI
jgi:Zn-dependent metalloprotease